MYEDMKAKAVEMAGHPVVLRAQGDGQAARGAGGADARVRRSARGRAARAAPLGRDAATGGARGDRPARRAAAARRERGTMTAGLQQIHRASRRCRRRHGRGRRSWRRRGRRPRRWRAATAASARADAGKKGRRRRTSVGRGGGGARARRTPARTRAAPRGEARGGLAHPGGRRARASREALRAAPPPPTDPADVTARLLAEHAAEVGGPTRRPGAAPRRAERGRARGARRARGAAAWLQARHAELRGHPLLIYRQEARTSPSRRTRAAAARDGGSRRALRLAPAAGAAAAPVLAAGRAARAAGARGARAARRAAARAAAAARADARHRDARLRRRRPLPPGHRAGRPKVLRAEAEMQAAGSEAWRRLGAIGAVHAAQRPAASESPSSPGRSTLASPGCATGKRPARRLPPLQVRAVGTPVVPQVQIAPAFDDTPPPPPRRCGPPPPAAREASGKSAGLAGLLELAPRDRQVMPPCHVAAERAAARDGGRAAARSTRRRPSCATCSRTRRPRAAARRGPRALPARASRSRSPPPSSTPSCAQAPRRLRPPLPPPQRPA